MGPPCGSAGQHSPDRLLAPKMGWLKLSLRRYTSGRSKPTNPDGSALGVRKTMRMLVRNREPRAFHLRHVAITRPATTGMLVPATCCAHSLNVYVHTRTLHHDCLASKGRGDAASIR